MKYSGLPHAPRLEQTAVQTASVLRNYCKFPINHTSMRLQVREEGEKEVVPISWA